MEKGEMAHIPVLEKEVLECLKPKINENFIDCTINGGGHSFRILEKTAPQGKILGIDFDNEIIEKLFKKTNIMGLEKRLILECGNFAKLKDITKKRNFGEASGILFDLGMSSWHIEESLRGFSFLRDEPLDMRYNTKAQKILAADIVNSWPEYEIAEILRDYGEECFAINIAKKIKEKRAEKRIISTFELVEAIREAVPMWYQKGRIHFATRTFQALRIAVNEELANVEEALPQAVDLLKKGGGLAVISFHSLEDRIVKNFLKDFVKKGKLSLLAKKPITASEKERAENPRCRSAKLRAAIKT